MRMRLTKLLLALLLAIKVAANDYGAGDTIIDTSSNNTKDVSNNLTVGEDGVIGPECLRLKNFYNSPTRYVQLFGIIRNVSVQFGRHATSRAKAALLMAGLRYRLGYKRIHMETGYQSYCDLLGKIPKFKGKSSVFDVLVVHTGAEWAGDDENCPAIKDSTETALGLTPRMQIIDTDTPIELRLHAHLTPDAWMDTECNGGAREWQFYTKKNVLQRCGFLHNLQPGLTWNPEDFKLPTINCTDDSPCVPLLFATEPGANNATVKRLLEYATRAELRLRPVPVYGDTALRRHLLNATTSFLFLDYDLWVSANTNKNRVCTVQPPPCLDVTCPRALDTNSARFVGDIKILAQSAQMIYDALIRLTPRPTELREVLELETDIPNHETGFLKSEEAACNWAYNHRERFESWINMKESNLWACVMFCKDDKDKEQYNKIIQIVAPLINETIKETRLLEFYNDTIDCHDPNALNQWLSDRKTRLEWTRMVGVIALGEGAAAAAAGFENEKTQLVLYDVPGAVQLNDAAWAVGGRVAPLASAITDFIVQQYWKRVAIISEDALIADNMTAALCANKVITCEKVDLKMGTTDEAKDILQKLDKRNARIFFVNARASTAAIVLCEAARLGFTQSARYAWIVREWYGSTDCEVKHIHPFTVSYWWRGGDESALELGGNKQLRDAISQKMGRNKTWPMMAAPVADGMLLLAHSMAARLRRFPWQRYDLHGGQNASRLVSESYTMNKPVLGVAQELRQQDHAQHQPLVFVYTWQESKSKLLQMLKVDEKGLITNKTILRQAYDIGAAPHDGSISGCLIKTTRDKFAPQCHDVVFFCAGAMILLIPIALWLARRARINHLERREQEIRMRLIARCERTATALAEHLVDRSALQIHEELGVGHFGCVRRGLLRLKHGRSKTVLICVAVKALRADAAAAEEAEFLREACALAALQHDHVVKLIGVCAADAPPLLLMEHAFNGDLLRYLRERRHLALINVTNANAFESETNDIEAAHVSPIELTRLAREAADALDYLSQKRFVHRDVRAANCLLDQRRSLKLADFGLARNTSSTSVKNESILTVTEPASDDYAYICQRRGLFPVPWMAPESVTRGVFSFMSDVWSLGVLVLEICTLGARPFGAWAASRVLGHVRSGAHPPLPTDLDYNTREVLEMCWRLEPTSRYTAAAIKSHLTKSPTAVQPAVRPAWIDQEADGLPSTDSGFGERDADNLPHSDPHISTL